MKDFATLSYIRKHLKEFPEQNIIMITKELATIEDIQLIAGELAQEFIQETSLVPLLVCPESFDALHPSQLNLADVIIATPSEVSYISPPKGSDNFTQYLQAGHNHRMLLERVTSVGMSSAVVIILQSSEKKDPGSFTAPRCSFGFSSLNHPGTLVFVSDKENEPYIQKLYLHHTEDEQYRIDRVIERIG